MRCERARRRGRRGDAPDVSGELVLGQHAFDGVLNRDPRVFLNHFFQFEFGQTTGETAVAIVFLVGKFVAGNLEVLGVNHDYVIAVVNVRGVGDFALAGQFVGNNDGQFAERHGAGVNQPPFALDVSAFLAVGFLRSGHYLPPFLRSISSTKEMVAISVLSPLRKPARSMRR